MNKEELATLFVRSSLSVRESLAKLDITGQGILLLVDQEGKLLRSITDGDLRRLILSGCSLDHSLDHLPYKKAAVVSEPICSRDILQQMNKCGINQLIIVDENEKPIDVVHRKDVDTAISLSLPHLGEEEQIFVSQALSTNWVAPVGPNIDAFEEELADKVGAKHAVALSSGTAAIHLALRLLNVGEGDRVFCSSFTFIASANPIVYLGAEPVFIDSEPDSWNMSPAALSKAFEEAVRVGKLPKAVIVVNLYGQSADMDPLLTIANRYQVPIVEDAAESLGATYKGRCSGTLGTLGIYSFNGNKIITTSGGGAIVTDDENMAREAKYLSTQAREPAGWYEHEKIGYNYRMSNVLAGIGRGQLKVLDSRVSARRRVFSRYQQLFSDMPFFSWMPEADFGTSTRWLSTVLINDDTLDIFELAEKMARENIEVRPLWKPLHKQPVFAGNQYFPHHPDQDMSARWFAKGLCLPSGSNLSMVQQERVADVIKFFLKAG